MIIPLYATSVHQVATRIVELRAQSGVAAMARGITLIIECDPTDLENSIQTACSATIEHPGRVVVVTTQEPNAASTLDAQIRVGSDGGSGEVIVMRLRGPATEHLDSAVRPLLIPDVPVAVWWPSNRPKVPANSPLGGLASRRITDARESQATLAQLTNGYTPGDTDLCWSRLTPWRSSLLAALHGRASTEPVTSAVVCGPPAVAGDLMAAWLASSLRVPTRLEPVVGSALKSVELHFSGGSSLMLDRENTAAGVVLRQSGLPDQNLVLSGRTTPDCLAEELRRLGPDHVYGHLVTEALPIYQRS